MPFDTALTRIWYTLRRKVRRSSGMQCAVNLFNVYLCEREQLDGHIVLTDMGAPKPIPSKCKRMWMTDNYGNKWPGFDAKPEKVLEVIVEEQSARI